METIIHADIFFFITSVGVVVFTVVLIIIAIKVAAILENVRHITEKVKNGVDEVSDSAQKIVKDIERDGMISTITKFAHRERSSKRSRTK